MTTDDAIALVESRRKLRNQTTGKPKPHVGEVIDELLAAKVKQLRQWVNDLTSGMYVNCVYCGHQYGPRENTPVAMADVLKEHIEKCSEHPLAAANNEIKQLREKLFQSEADREDERQRQGQSMAKVCEERDRLRKESIRLTRMSDDRGRALEICFAYSSDERQDAIADVLRRKYT